MRDSIRKKRWILVGTLVAAAATGIPPAFGYLDMAWPGTICRATAMSLQQNLSYSEFGFVTVDSGGGNVQVECPLIKDGPAGTSLNALYAYVDPADGTTLTCYAYCYSAGGTSQDSDAETTSGNAAQTLSWGTAINDCSANGYYVVRCTMEPDDRIYGVKWVE